MSSVSPPSESIINRSLVILFIVVVSCIILLSYFLDLMGGTPAGKFDEVYEEEHEEEYEQEYDEGDYEQMLAQSTPSTPAGGEDG